MAPPTKELILNARKMEIISSNWCKMDAGYPLLGSYRPEVQDHVNGWFQRMEAHNAQNGLSREEIIRKGRWEPWIKQQHAEANSLLPQSTSSSTTRSTTSTTFVYTTQFVKDIPIISDLMLRLQHAFYWSGSCYYHALIFWWTRVLERFAKDGGDPFDDESNPEDPIEKFSSPQSSSSEDDSNAGGFECSGDDERSRLGNEVLVATSLDRAVTANETVLYQCTFRNLFTPQRQPINFPQTASWKYCIIVVTN